MASNGPYPSAAHGSETDARVEVRGRIATVRKQIESLREGVAYHEQEIARSKARIAECTRLALSYECLLNPGGALAAKGAFTIRSDDGLQVAGGGVIGIDTARTTGTDSGVRVTCGEVRDDRLRPM